MLLRAASLSEKAWEAKQGSPQQVAVPGPFASCFPVTFGIPAGKEGPFLTSPAGGCRRASAAPSACCVASPAVKSPRGRLSVLQHCVPAPEGKLPLESHLGAVVTLRRVEEILMPGVLLLLA